MRIKHFFGLAVLAAMTASCSSNNDLVVGGGNGSGENESGTSYASITIDLPTTSGTRAANDKFDGGTASEYTVNDATLLIFKKAGTSENTFEYVETAKLGNLEPWKKDNTRSIGWIAQHVLCNPHLKDIVETDEKGYYKINYWSPKLIATAFGAIEQVGDEVSRLKARVVFLESEVQRLSGDKEDCNKKRLDNKNINSLN